MTQNPLHRLVLRAELQHGNARIVTHTIEISETLAFVRSLHALKRMATPKEIAHSALYLASDASSFTTGSAMLVDGGVSINRV